MPNGKVSLAWADGEHMFNVAKIGQALELEEKCNCGVAGIFERLSSGKWYVNDVRETLRLGLIGGGMEPGKALILIRRYFDDRPWQENVQAALVVLMAAMVGVPGDEIGKKPEAERAMEKGNPSSAPTDDSSTPRSMDSAQGSAGTRA